MFFLIQFIDRNWKWGKNSWPKSKWIKNLLIVEVPNQTTIKIESWQVKKIFQHFFFIFICLEFSFQASFSIWKLFVSLAFDSNQPTMDKLGWLEENVAAYEWIIKLSLLLLSVPRSISNYNYNELTLKNYCWIRC